MRKYVLQVEKTLLTARNDGVRRSVKAWSICPIRVPASSAKFCGEYDQVTLRTLVSSRTRRSPKLDLEVKLAKHATATARWLDGCSESQYERFVFTLKHGQGNSQPRTANIPLTMTELSLPLQ